jgi:hypothetical protein
MAYEPANLPDVFKKAYPERGVLWDYLCYAYPLTDAPPQYHLGVGITLAATCLGTRVYIPFGHKKIYPNIWAMIIGKTSFFRKSTCLRLGRKVLWNVDPELVYPTEFSPESLVEILAKRPQGVFAYPEFSLLLEMMDRSYMIGLKPLLTDLFDCPEVYIKKLKYAIHEVKDPCISIMSASTLDWLEKSLRESDLHGGFMQRFIYLVATKKDRRVVIPPAPDRILKSKVIDGFSELRKTEGPFVLDEAGRNIYSDWLRKFEDECQVGINSSILSGFYTRLEDYALKIALIYEVTTEGGGGDQVGKISIDSLMRALSFVKYLSYCVRSLVTEQIQFSRFGKQKRKVYDFIKDNPGSKKGDLMKYTNLPKRELDPVLETLSIEGSIDIKRDGRAETFHVV